MAGQRAISEGDVVGLTGDITRVGDDGTVSVWVRGYPVPMTIRIERVNLIATRQRVKAKRDKPD